MKYTLEQILTILKNDEKEKMDLILKEYAQSKNIGFYSHQIHFIQYLFFKNEFNFCIINNKYL